MNQPSAVFIRPDNSSTKRLDATRQQSLMVLLVLLEWFFVSLEKFDDLSLRAQMKLEEKL
ncbi:MAG: hypothetical protein ACQES2_10905 [Pseudomonadota bacterium]